MTKIIVAGIGVDVGKTVVSAVLTTLLKGDYWKPIQCGGDASSDTATMQKLIDTNTHTIFPSVYSFQASVSPHHAARLENVSIDLRKIIPPVTKRPLIIESVGGIYVPLTLDALSFDLFKTWSCQWIVVSRHYIGSINHTLLTVAALKKEKIPILGLIFNGEPNQDSEAVILKNTKLSVLGRLFPELVIQSQTIQKYVKQWLPYFPQQTH